MFRRSWTQIRCRLKRGVVFFIVFGLLLAIVWARLTALSSADSGRLAGQVAENLPYSGVTNPVTAVLRNFRAYDTLLELADLLAAVLGILALCQARPGFPRSGPVPDGLTRWLVPLLIVFAGYLLWVGAHAPGGAFQAGALLAAAAVLLRLGGHAGVGLPGAVMQRWILVSGIVVFLTLGLAVTAGGLHSSSIRALGPAR